MIGDWIVIGLMSMMAFLINCCLVVAVLIGVAHLIEKIKNEWR